jgi:hypothetical protein
MIIDAFLIRLAVRRGVMDAHRRMHPGDLERSFSGRVIRRG